MEGVVGIGCTGPGSAHGTDVTDPLASRGGRPWFGDPWPQLAPLAHIYTHKQRGRAFHPQRWVDVEPTRGAGDLGGSSSKGDEQARAFISLLPSPAPRPPRAPRRGRAFYPRPPRTKRESVVGRRTSPRSRPLTRASVWRCSSCILEHGFCHLCLVSSMRSRARARARVCVCVCACASSTLPRNLWISEAVMFLFPLVQGRSFPGDPCPTKEQGRSGGRMARDGCLGWHVDLLIVILDGRVWLRDGRKVGLGPERGWPPPPPTPWNSNR
ncbi:hypothetical protein LZ30DRAFT_7089 [Colletotrichum cereale]|nr:hypothetical protein LZ30DRAFT_7089 [Colletotrichum cereale]